VDLRLSWLQSFLVLAEELHFARAARRLHVSPSALSRQIRQLEEVLGVKLFRRSTRSVILSDAGRKLVVDLREPIADLLRVLRRSDHERPGGPALSYTGAAAATLIPALVARWTSVGSDPLRLVPAGSAAQLDGLRNRAIDVGVQWEGPQGDEFAVHPLRTTPMWIALPAHHRLASLPSLPLELLAAETWLLAADHSDVTIRDSFRRRCESVGFRPRIRNAATGNEAQLALVAAGQGICMASEIVARVPRSGVAFTLVSGHTVQLVAVTRHEGDPFVERVVELLRELSA